MPICTRCHARLDADVSICTHCKSPAVTLLDGSDGGKDGVRRPVRGAEPAADGVPDGDGPYDERLVLLLEEPLPEVAAMIREFLENSGIACVVKGEPIGLLYRLPMLGASFSGAQVYVHASDFAEAHDLITQFFKKN